MFMQDWKKEVFTIPNLLSLFRLALIPVYMAVYLNAAVPWHYYLAGGILALSCLTDAVDGQVARHFHMVSNLGKVLDPFADKITQLTLTLCLSLRYRALGPVLLIFLVKELFQLIAGVVNLRRGKMLPGALFAGKVCTTVLFVSFILIVLFPALPEGYIRTISILDCLFLFFSFGGYLSAYLGRNGKVQDIDPN
jgi:cardiolipin synthase